MPVDRELDRVVGEDQRVDELAFGQLARRLGALEGLTGGIVELGQLRVVLPDPGLGRLDLSLDLIDPRLGHSAVFGDFLGHVRLDAHAVNPKTPKRSAALESILEPHLLLTICTSCKKVTSPPGPSLDVPGVSAPPRNRV